MKISIITPSYNQARFINDTIVSVAGQTYPDIEHIIIDGLSDDGTSEIVRGYPTVKFISEKDNGQSEAINKGFAIATGEIICWLNSDDYYEPDIIADIMAEFSNDPECCCVYGDITYVDINKHFIKKETGAVLSYENLIRNPDIVRQPSIFWRKSVIAKIGPLDESLHLVMDYDFLLRLSKQFECRYIPKNVSFFRIYDESKTSSRNQQQAMELLRVWRNRTGRITVRQIAFFCFRYFNIHRTRIFALVYPMFKKVMKRYAA